MHDDQKIGENGNPDIINQPNVCRLLCGTSNQTIAMVVFCVISNIAGVNSTNILKCDKTSHETKLEIRSSYLNKLGR